MPWQEKIDLAYLQGDCLLINVRGTGTGIDQHQLKIALNSRTAISTWTISDLPEGRIVGTDMLLIPFQLITIVSYITIFHRFIKSKKPFVCKSKRV